MVERLSACSLVCRAWRIRAQALLFERIVLNHEGLPSLDRVLRENHVVCSSITEMYVQGESKTTSFSFFAIRHQLPNLTYLNIHQLDLTREHPWLYRAPLFRSVQRLKLYRLKPCQLSQLVLFINSFYSLVRLDLDFDFAQLEHRDQILPKPSCIDTRSLIWIELDLNPGVSRLIFWFLKAKPLLERLKTLVLYIFIFPNLKYITYGSLGRDFVLRHAVRQLGNVTSTCGLIQIEFDIRLDDGKKGLYKDLCGLDQLLNGATDEYTHSSKRPLCRGTNHC